MYSREKRMKAIELYTKYDKPAAAVGHELGYPSRHLLARWYNAYLKNAQLRCAVEPAVRKVSPGTWCHAVGVVESVSKFV